VKYKIEEIPDYRRVVYNRSDPFISQIDPRSEQGSYLDRVSMTNLEPDEKLVNIRKSLKAWKVKGRLRFVEWVTAPRLGTCMDQPVKGLKLSNISSSKFCTGRHLQLYNEAVKILKAREEEPEEEDEGPKKKRRKTEKPFSGVTSPMAELVEDSRIMYKISKLYPDIVSTTKVVSLTTHNGSEKLSNVLKLECEPKHQLKLIDTVISAISGLDPGDHIIFEGFPLFTRITVAIFLSIASLFEDIGFVRPFKNDRLILLSKFLAGKNSSAAEESLGSLERILTEVMNAGSDKQQVLSVWSIQDLVQDPIYSEMVLFNQLSLKEQILHLTSFLDPNRNAEEAGPSKAEGPPANAADTAAAE